MRELEGKLAGFSCVLHPESVTPDLEEADPIVRNGMEHLKVSPVPAMLSALLIRRWLSRESGEGPCGVLGAFFLDLKRTYFKLVLSRRTGSLTLLMTLTFQLSTSTFYQHINRGNSLRARWSKCILTPR